MKLIVVLDDDDTYGSLAGSRIVAIPDDYDNDFSELFVEESYQHGAFDITKFGDTLWENDLIQFARLLNELEGLVTQIQMEALEESMDLGAENIYELFERAQAVFDKSKEIV